MVRRHLSGDFRFVCLTDDADGVRNEVQCLPIPPLDAAAGHARARLDQAHHLRGRPARPARARRCSSTWTWSIVDAIDALLRAARRVPHHPRLEAAVARDRQLVGLPLRSSARMPTCWQRFRDARRRACASASATSRPTCPTTCTSRASWPTGPAAGARSWKYHCVPRLPLNYWRAPSIPAGARILIFHGVINPPDAIQGGHTARGRFLLPSPWVTEHWSA